MKPLWREMTALPAQSERNAGYDVLDGRELREQIARLMLDGGSTWQRTKCHHQRLPRRAVEIALLSVCGKKDIVAIESPSFHGTMQMLRGFDIKAIEIPCRSSNRDQH